MPVITEPEPSTPVSSLQWATSGTVTEPTGAAKASGVTVGGRLAAGIFNWIVSKLAERVAWLRNAVVQLDAGKFGNAEHMIPSVTNTYDIGTEDPVKRWRNASVTNLYVAGEVRGPMLGGLDAAVGSNAAPFAGVFANYIRAKNVLNIPENAELIVEGKVTSNFAPNSEVDDFTLGTPDDRWKELWVGDVRAENVLALDATVAGDLNVTRISSPVVLSTSQGINYFGGNKLVARTIAKAWARIGIASGSFVVKNGLGLASGSGAVQFIPHETLPHLKIGFSGTINDAAPTAGISKELTNHIVSVECDDGAVTFCRVYFIDRATGLAVDPATLTGNLSLHVDGTINT